MVEAYILITAAIGKVKEVARKLKELDNIKSVRVVTGPYDIIVLAEAKDLTTLTNTVVEDIHRISGVVDTNTAIVVETGY
ncbi:MAG: Lrp/AsnC ligand binding domain-containing protein [Hadesarchaea archaeon]|nr:Lrp/AsnC ligand binding domain-containing protein [Hadesarchaea archaeon]